MFFLFILFFIFLGGGGLRDYVRAHTSQVQSPKSLTAGVQSPGHLRAPEALRVINALSCYLSPIFKHSDKKWEKN